jgi:DNA uptake protein ComE-like DNA-binding protein
MGLFQNTKNGQIVEFIGHHDKDWAMVKNSTGVVQYIALDDLVEYQVGVGRTDKKPQPQSAETPKDEDAIPETTIPIDTRLNLNAASAESIAKTVKGIGYATAKKIIELKMSLPGEKFQKLDQLRKIGRVDWDAVFKADLIYVGP